MIPEDAPPIEEEGRTSRPTRRGFLRAAAGAIVAAGTGYSCLVEPNQITIENVRLVLPRLPEAFHGIRIVQFSDLHFGHYTGKREIGRAVEQANALKPDLAVVTGDFVTAPYYGTPTNEYAYVDACGEVLAGLRTPLGTFACLGNHDVSVDPYGVTQILKGRGLKVLRNSSAVVEQHGARFWIAGVDDVLYARADLDRTLVMTPHDEFTVLLAHEPDFADHAKSYPIDLQLSGHSHGGQIRLPLIGALYYPPLSRKYPQGLYRVGNLHLYTNRGIGTIVVPARFLAPPEITLFTLLSRESA